MTINIYKPYLPPSSLRFAHEALDSSWVSSQGKYINMVQEKLQELFNVKYALPVSNGTAACHLMAKVLVAKYNIKSVIVPGNVYVACYNSLLMDNDLKLISIDADINTWNIDLNLLDTAIKNNPDSAVMIVHNMGNVINVPALKRKYPNTIFIEDSCEALLGKYEGIYAGTESVCSAFSFFGNKTLTSGQGGAILTNDEEIYQFIKRIHAQGMTEKRFIHDIIGQNYRITNIECALLYGQLEIYEEILELKNKVFTNYHNAFKDREDKIVMQKNEENTSSANWMFGLRIKGQNYDYIEKYFTDNEIEARPLFYPIDRHKHLQNNLLVSYDTNDIGRLLNKECIILPSFPELSLGEQRHIINVVEQLI